MKAARIHATWAPKKGFELGPKDIDGKLSYLGSQVWKNPKVTLEDLPVPKPGPDEVLIKIRVCGVCGSDVHMAQQDEAGYIWYPGLTAFPCVLGHEFSGTVEEAGDNAINKRTGRRFEAGEPVCAEEMFWCGRCRPCADGFPNHCEALQEIGFTCDGGYAEYVKVNAKYLWSLEPLRERYGDDGLFLAGSLCEPTSVAYNAVIERAKGIRPGEAVVIIGGGPIGLAATAILAQAGASRVIISEPSAERRKLAIKLGATDAVDPVANRLSDAVLEITRGMGASLYMEASGVPDKIFPEIERCIWLGRELNAMVVLVARATQKIPLTGEVFQVRRAGIVGSQGHSGHGNFPKVIACMSKGMDLTPMITRKVSLDQAPEALKRLQTDRSDCKVSVFPQGVR
jgi:threonine dehydrogenase-like Zn-dependent dehydrogenase